MSLPTTIQSVRQLLSTVLILLAIVCFNCGGWAEGTDFEALNHCHKLHNQTIFSNSEYHDDYCSLDCYLYGDPKPKRHNLNEGLRCPSVLINSFVCKNGKCVSNEAVSGKLRLKIVSATMFTPINGYATACFINTTEKINLPMRDRSGCFDCVTELSRTTENPIWNFQCDSFNMKKFSNDTKVVLEVWHYLSQNNEYQGGVVLDLPKLDRNKNIKWDFNSKLEGGILNETIRTELRWTASGIVA